MEILTCSLRAHLDQTKEVKVDLGKEGKVRQSHKMKTMTICSTDVIKTY